MRKHAETTSLPASPTRLDQPPAPPVCRPLIDSAAIDRARQALTLADAGPAGDALLADVARHAPRLQACADEAEAVLRGRLDAATRLWLLLRSAPEPDGSIPPSVLESVAGDAWHRPPAAMDADALLRLVAGVVRAADHPQEAERMLGALAQWLQPLFRLEAAAAAAQRARVGETGALKTFVTAHAAARSRAAPADPAVPLPTRDLPGAFSSTLDPDRVPFDVQTWRDAAVKPGISSKDWGWGCLGGTQRGMSQIDRFGPRYVIASIDRPAACAGDTVTVRGTGFGPTGRVSFESPKPTDPAFALGAGDPAVLVGVTPKRWTDTEIEVVVPVWATAGELHLDAFTRHSDHCTTIDVYRLGSGIFFGGGLASVYQVSIGGVNIDLDAARPPNLTPNDAVALTWHSSGGPSTRVRIELVSGGKTLWQDSGPGGFGGVVLKVPDVIPREPTRAMLVFTASSDCGSTAPLSVPVWISVPPRLTIEYAEVTQGVQRDLADVLAGRALPTVAFKDTAVRVHLACDRGGWFGNKLDRITGALLVDNRRLAPTNVRNVRPDRGFVQVIGRSDPSETNDTLNFSIPAAWLTPGPHTLTVQVACDDPSGRIQIGQTFVWNWVQKRALPVRALYMKFFSGSTEFLLDYTRRALDFMPTPLTDIGIASPLWLTMEHDVSDKDGIGDQLDDLEDAWGDADETSGVRWLGIVPSGLLGSTLGISHNPSTAVLAIESRPEVGAHELGHSLGLNHVNLPSSGSGEPDGPYEPATDNGGFLRRPPFDVRPSAALGLPAGDLMSYLVPIRPGVSSWTRMFDEI